MLLIFPSTPQSPCGDSSPSGEPFGLRKSPPQKPAPKGEVAMSDSELTEGLHRGCSFFRQPLSRHAATAPRPGSLLVQCKHIVQCRTPRGAIVSMGLRGVQGGLRGEIEIFPGPPAKKHYIFRSFSSSQRFFTRKVATWLPWLPRPRPSSAPLARACAEAT